MNMAEYNGVWVFAEQRSGELQSGFIYWRFGAAL